MSTSAANNAVDAVTGVVTVSIAGITAALTPEDARSWGEVLTSYAPLLLIGFLIWRLRLMDRTLANCEKRHKELEGQHSILNNKLLLAYAASNPHSSRMPSLEEFDRGDFNLRKAVKETSDA